MDEDLQDSYDAIIYGTGLVECLVAGAAARAGKSVLHLDNDCHYGSQWASFNLCDLQDWISEQKEQKTTPISECCDVAAEKELVPMPPVREIYNNIVSSWHIEKSVQSVASSDENKDEKDNSNTKVVTDAEDVADTLESVPIFMDASSPVITDKSIVDTAAECNSADEPPIESSSCLSRDCWTQDRLLQNSRRFNIDLAPKILYARGPMVELLISSNVARYVEFKCISNIMCWSNDRLVSVPCSRSQVFSSKAVSLLDKRLLMKFLQFAAEYSQHTEQWEGMRNAPLSEYLTQQRITGQLQEYVLSGMALAGRGVSVEEGLEAIKLFLTSLGRFGSSPFLATLYGSGELPQAFCRLCAVFAGTYILDRSISAVSIIKSSSNDRSKRNEDCNNEETEKTEDNTAGNNINITENIVDGVVSKGKHIKCKHLVLDDRFAETFSDLSSKQTTEHSVSRAVVIINCNLLKEKTMLDPAANVSDSGKSKIPGHGGVCLAQLTSKTGEPVTVLQFAADTSVCMTDTWLLHLSCVGSSAEEDLSPVLEQLLQQQSTSDTHLLPSPVLYSLYYNQSVVRGHHSLYSNLHFCYGPDHQTLDYNAAVDQARNIFSNMFPEEEFMPRAPDPDEIIFDDPPAQQENTEEEQHTIGDNDTEKHDQQQQGNENKTIKETSSEDMDTS